MLDDLLVECPIHLDAVSIKDILVFKCGHGFCEPCLEEHFAPHRTSTRPSCPACRKSIRRNEAFHLFLTPAHSHSQTQSGIYQSGFTPADSDACHTRLMRELREVKAAHAHCPDRVLELQQEMNILRQNDARHDQTIHHLRGRYEILEGRLAKEVDNATRAQEESSRLREEVTRLHVENHKTSVALEQASKEVQTQRERVKLFQGYIEQYKHKCSLEKKKRKAIENANHRPPSKKEEESLMVIDSNAPDILQDGLDFGWLDEACKVKGDQLAVSDDEQGMEWENEGEENEVAVRFDDSDNKGKRSEDQVKRPPLRFISDWNFEPGGLSGGATRKRSIGGSKIVKVKAPSTGGGPLAIDRHGRVKGMVALGSRQKLNSKN